MDNMNDVRKMFTELAAEAGVSEDYYKELMADFDRIVGGGNEVFEVEGYQDARYVLFHREDGKWDWVFEDPVVGHEYGGVFSDRRDAMYAMARDADDTLFVDSGMGTRIRRAI